MRKTKCNAPLLKLFLNFVSVSVFAFAIEIKL